MKNYHLCQESNSPLIRCVLRGGRNNGVVCGAHENTQTIHWGPKEDYDTYVRTDERDDKGRVIFRLDRKANNAIHP